jgi:hypothetical protein
MQDCENPTVQHRNKNVYRTVAYAKPYGDRLSWANSPTISASLDLAQSPSE